MERGVYFDAWFPGHHCYHPSLPPRRPRMAEYHATAVVLSALGGGSIALPYLAHEAFGEIDPRFRFYGFVNDVEFIAECRKHGVKVFDIVFEVQGWEFPVELNETEDSFLALNEPRGVGKRDWLGLREFSQDRDPNLWFDAEADRTPPLPELTVEISLPERFGALSLHSPGGEMTGDLENDGAWHRILLRDVPLYGIVLLTPA